MRAHGQPSATIVMQFYSGKRCNFIPVLTVYHGVADLYCYFFERGLRLLKEGGRMGYISSSTFFKTNSGKPLREFLPKAATLEHVVDFGDVQVFEGVITYPAILTMKNMPPKKNHEVSFWNMEDLPQANFRATYAKSHEPYPQNALGDGSWEFENPKLKALRDKIREGKPTLKEVYGSPLYGVKTGRNEAFVIDRKTRDRLIAEDPKSAEILNPWLEGKDLQRWRAESRNLSIILFPKGWSNEVLGEDTEEDNWLKLAQKYPAISNHLSFYETVCKNRSDKGDYWWEQRACDYYDKFQAPKITYPHFSQGRKFLIDASHSYSNDKTYIIPYAEFFLLGLLNSLLTWFDLRSICSAMRGGEWRLELRVQYTETIAIPPATNKQKTELATLAEASQASAENRFKLQQDVRRRIPDLCPPERDPKLNNKLKDWWTLPDFASFQKEIKKLYKTEIPLRDRSDWEDWLNADKAKINQLTAEIEANEDKINALVYELFELTDEEIKLLEANI